MVRSFLLSMDDDNARPSERLLDVALEAIQATRSLPLADIAARCPPPQLPSLWPGEHYRLLAGLVSALRPQTVLDIGTFTGASALALLAALPPGGRVVSFDLADWRDMAGTVLRESDFADGRLTHHVVDLSSDPPEYRHVLAEADLVLLDASHDGETERRFFEVFDRRLRSGCLVLMDDIRFIPLIPVWRELRKPKLDLTSFGHWTGSGLVEWAQAERL